jgi:hypothetical protein
MESGGRCEIGGFSSQAESKWFADKRELEPIRELSTSSDVELTKERMVQLDQVLRFATPQQSSRLSDRESQMHLPNRKNRLRPLRDLHVFDADWYSSKLDFDKIDALLVHADFVTKAVEFNVPSIQEHLREFPCEPVKYQRHERAEEDAEAWTATLQSDEFQEYLWRLYQHEYRKVNDPARKAALNKSFRRCVQQLSKVEIIACRPILDTSLFLDVTRPPRWATPRQDVMVKDYEGQGPYYVAHNDGASNKLLVVTTCGDEDDPWFTIGLQQRLGTSINYAILNRMLGDNVAPVGDLLTFGSGKFDAIFQQHRIAKGYTTLNAYDIQTDPARAQELEAVATAKANVATTKQQTEKAKKEAEEKAKKEAAKKEAKEKVKKEAADKAKKEAAEKARKEAAEKARQVAKQEAAKQEQARQDAKQAASMASEMAANAARYAQKDALSANKDVDYLQLKIEHEAFKATAAADRASRAAAAAAVAARSFVTMSEQAMVESANFDTKSSNSIISIPALAAQRAADTDTLVLGQSAAETIQLRPVAVAESIPAAITRSAPAASRSTVSRGAAKQEEIGVEEVEEASMLETQLSKHYQGRQKKIRLGKEQGVQFAHFLGSPTYLYRDPLIKTIIVSFAGGELRCTFQSVVSHVKDPSHGCAMAVIFGGGPCLPHCKVECAKSEPINDREHSKDARYVEHHAKAGQKIGETCEDSRDCSICARWNTWMDNQEDADQLWRWKQCKWMDAWKRNIDAVVEACASAEGSVPRVVVVQGVNQGAGMAAEEEYLRNTSLKLEIITAFDLEVNALILILITHLWTITITGISCKYLHCCTARSVHMPMCVCIGLLWY